MGKAGQSSGFGVRIGPGASVLYTVVSITSSRNTYTMPFLRGQPPAAVRRLVGLLHEGCAFRLMMFMFMSLFMYHLCALHGRTTTGLRTRPRYGGSARRANRSRYKPHEAFGSAPDQIDLSSGQPSESQKMRACCCCADALPHSVYFYATYIRYHTHEPDPPLFVYFVVFAFS